MKKLFFILSVSLVIFSSCEKQEIYNLPEAYNISPSVNRATTTTYPSNEMIVKYNAGTSEFQKQTIRNSYQVSSFKKCPCADPTIELWIFEKDSQGNIPGGSIEEIVVGAKDDSGLEGVDFNPIIKHLGQKPANSFGFENNTVALEKIVPKNTDLTIAILDTGVDYNYFGFQSPFLYNVKQGPDPYSDQGLVDYYGWDFVNGDNNPFDDYGHGTVVSSIIYEALREKNVDFQILPVKVFDQHGNGSYFDILCGFKYAAKNTDVDIINMSFGWYAQKLTLLEQSISELENDILITSSAGNKHLNTDQHLHYPSSHSSANILSIAAINNDPLNIDLAWFSNYGPNTVDIAAPGEDIPFYITPNDYVTFSGTSFSCAFASAFAGEHYSPGISVSDHIEKIISNTVEHPNLDGIKYQSYIDD